MSYIINKTDGTRLVEIMDGTIDQLHSDLSLLGRNSSSYGGLLDENFVYLLENFANQSPPNRPLCGQLWYDTSVGRMKVYDSSIGAFKVSGGTIVAPSAPSYLSAGDLWISTRTQQVFFNDGFATVLIGPSYTAEQGISGMQTVDVLDINQNTQVVVFVYVANVLLGIFSKAAFTPSSIISGYGADSLGNSLPIYVGFNAGNYTGTKLHATASEAEALIDPRDGSLHTANMFVNSSGNSSIIGTLSILANVPLILGSNSNNEISATTDSLSITSNSMNQNFNLNLLNSDGLKTAITVDAASQCIGVYNAFPSAMLDVNGDVMVRGSLTVAGNITAINTTNIEIEDKTIALAFVESPTDTTADGAGLVVKGATDKLFVWNHALTAWTTTEHINIDTSNSYKIGGVPVLSSSSLGTGITHSSLTSVGVLAGVHIDNLYVSGSAIRFVNSARTFGNITLAPLGAGYIDTSSAVIKNVGNGVDEKDCVNVITMATALRSMSLSISLDTTNMNNSQISSVYLSKIFPNVNSTTGTTCTVVCTDTGDVTLRVFTMIAGIWTWQNNI